MSQNNENLIDEAASLESEIALPEGDIVDDAPPPAAKKGLSASKKLAAVGGGLLVLFAGAFVMTSGQAVVDPSSTRAPGALDSTPGGQVQANSEEYQRSVELLNERRAEAAAALGVTSMPTPEVIMTPMTPLEGIDQITREPEPEPAAAEAPREEVRIEPRRSVPRPPPPVPQIVQAAPADGAGGAMVQGGAEGEVPENPYISRITGMMNSGVNSFVVKPMATGTVASGAATGADAPSAVPGNQIARSDVSTPDGPDYSAENMLLRPGDVLYAETLTTVSSDMNSPVMAEIVHGPHKGARVVGSFSADPTAGKMVVTFTNMTFKDGRVYDISAVAVDGHSAETAVASDVERRYVARYAPILAATFISGYAQARAQPRQTVVGTGDNAQVVTEQSDARAAVSSGLAAASAAIASDIAASAPKGPKIILRQGWPVGIMITDRVLIDTPVKEDPYAVAPAIVPAPGMPSPLPAGVRGGAAGGL